jgi:hypothetical protein
MNINIDMNALITVITIAVAVYFAIGYFRAGLDERLNTMSRNHHDQISEIYREHEKMWQQIFSLEKSGKSEKSSSDKDNYYNTTA